MISYEILQTVSGERLISSIIWDTIIIMTKRRSKSAWTGAQSLNFTLAINNKCTRIQKVFQNFVVKYLEKKNGFLQNQRYRNYGVRGPQF